MKKETEYQAIERRRKQYKCNGHCYGYNNPETGEYYQVCGDIDCCDETRKTEFLATLTVVIFLILIMVVPSCIMLYMIWGNM